MKTIKKMLSLAVSLMMVFSLMTVVKAAPANTTITVPENGHTYEVYQLFTGELSEGILSNVSAGTNLKAGTDVKAALTALQGLTGTTTEKAAAIAAYVDFTTTPVVTIGQGQASNKCTVPTGYYLIKDVAYTTGENVVQAYSLYVVEVVGPTTITPKADAPEVEKKVYDEDKGWNDGATYDIGDSIPYKLTATLGDTSLYQTYYVQFDDVLCKGLDLVEDSVKVYVVNGESKVEVTNSFTKEVKDYTGTKEYLAGGKVLYVTCSDVKAIEGVTIATGTQIVVEYNATLNTQAIIGTPGNFNEVTLKYSNNPNIETGGTPPSTPPTEVTPPDKVVVFTFDFDVNKVAKNANNELAPLAGAGFTLYKKSGDNWVKIGDEVKGTDMTTFTWTGLGEGTYKIEETTTPAGYNTIDPIEFTVDAEWSQGENPVLESLKVKDKAGNETASFATSLTSREVKDGVVGSANITTDIENNKGATLPSTGGMGTTMIYVGGASLMAIAAILLISKKRMALK